MMKKLTSYSGSVCRKAGGGTIRLSVHRRNEKGIIYTITEREDIQNVDQYGQFGYGKEINGAKGIMLVTNSRLCQTRSQQLRLKSGFSNDAQKTKCILFDRMYILRSCKVEKKFWLLGKINIPAGAEVFVLNCDVISPQKKTVFGKNTGIFPMPSV